MLRTTLNAGNSNLLFTAFDRLHNVDAVPMVFNNSAFAERFDGRRTRATEN